MIDSPPEQPAIITLKSSPRKFSATWRLRNVSDEQRVFAGYDLHIRPRQQLLLQQDRINLVRGDRHRTKEELAAAQRVMDQHRADRMVRPVHVDRREREPRQP